jgi:hypothetical protein
MEQILRTDHLANGVRIDFIDGSNRYFGDYHRLRIEVRCRIAVTPQLFVATEDPCAEADRVRSRLGDEIFWIRYLERMGISTGDLETVRNEMIESFVKSSFSYLQSPQFSSRFVALELAKCQKKVHPFRLVK